MPVDDAAVRFSYEGLVVEVRCSDPSHLDWVEEFVSPQFAREDRGSPHCRLSLIFDENRFDEIASRGPSGEKAAAFVLDNEVVALPLWCAEDAKRVVFDGKFEVFYLVDGQCVTLLARENRRNLRTPLMRVLREFAMNHAQNAGGFFLHASSFSKLSAKSARVVCKAYRPLSTASTSARPTRRPGPKSWPARRPGAASC